MNEDKPQTIEEALNENKPKTIEEAINSLQNFFEVDLWWASQFEWKTDSDMLNYLDSHFKILKQEIKEIQDKEKNENNK